MKFRHLLACAAAAGVLLALGVTAASGSTVKANVRAAIKSAASHLTTQDAHVQGAIENYANPEYSTGTPMELETAIGEELAALGALRNEVKSLKIGAKHALLRFGKAEMLLGIKMVSGAYEALSTTFASPSVTPKLARVAFRSERGTLRPGLRKLRTGARIVR